MVADTESALFQEPATASQNEPSLRLNRRREQNELRHEPDREGDPASERSIRANATMRVFGRRRASPRQSSTRGPTPRPTTAATTKNAPAFMNTWANTWRVAPARAGAVPTATPMSIAQPG